LLARLPQHNSVTNTYTYVSTFLGKE